MTAHLEQLLRGHDDRPVANPETDWRHPAGNRRLQRAMNAGGVCPPAAADRAVPGRAPSARARRTRVRRGAFAQARAASGAWPQAGGAGFAAAGVHAGPWAAPSPNWLARGGCAQPGLWLGRGGAAARGAARSPQAAIGRDTSPLAVPGASLACGSATGGSAASVGHLVLRRSAPRSRRPGPSRGLVSHL